MALRLITAPATTGVTLAEAKANGRIDYSDEDTLIGALIVAATARAERMTGLAFEPQTWEESLTGFPCDEITLGIGPLVSVTSVKYDDANGDEQTLSASDYVVDAASVEGRIFPVSTWPATIDRVNSVRIRFVAGLGTPSDVKQAILLIVEHWNEHRSEASPDNIRSIPLASEALLGLHRRPYV